jgi:hypothetical protein
MRECLVEKVRRNELEQEAVFAAGLLARADIELMARPYLESAVRIAVALDHPAMTVSTLRLPKLKGPILSLRA